MQIYGGCFRGTSLWENYVHFLDTILITLLSNACLLKDFKGFVKRFLGWHVLQANKGKHWSGYQICIKEHQWKQVVGKWI